MCGLAGFLAFGATGRPPSRVAETLAAAMPTRGRDGTACYADEHIALASVRHAVVAKATALQPLVDLTERYILVGSGEVFNHRQLRWQQQGRLPDNPALGDLYVALEDFAQRGCVSFEDIRGPFALAIWDRVDRVLTMACDRLGERTIYLRRRPDSLVFASEMRTAQALGDPANVDPSALVSFLALGRVPGPRTPLRGVERLAPGSVVQITAADGVQRTRDPLKPMSDLRSSPPDEQELAMLLDRAITRSLVADDPVGLAFSGGIDSSVVLAAAHARNRIGPVFTLYSPSCEDVNLERAKRVAGALGVNLTAEPFVLPTLQSAVSVLQETLDGPAAEPLVLHNDALHALAGTHARVLVGGHGADEVFAGYRRYTELAASLARVQHTREWMRGSNWERWQRTANWMDVLRNVLSDDGLACIDPVADPLERPFAFSFTETTDPVTFSQAMDLLRLMAYENFRVPDENGLARGVEVRSPFFDIDLIAGAWSLPVSTRLTNPAKSLLRPVFAGTPIASVFDDIKVGFDDHFDYPGWLAKNLQDIQEIVESSELRKSGLLTPDALSVATSRGDWRLLWRMFALAVWMDRR